MANREIYLENYWILFLTFVSVFDQLTYNGIPLPLLANFYQYIDENLKSEMMNSGFKKQLYNSDLKEGLKQDEIQVKFEKWINPLRRSAISKPTNGKLLLNLRYLRFTNLNYSNYFDKKNTVIFTERGKNTYQGFQMDNINNYKKDTSSIQKELIQKAKEIFKSLKNQPVFSNQNLYNKFINDIPLMVDTIASVSKYLEKKPVSCIVVGTTEDLTCRVLTLVGASKGIPSICMQHGTLCGDEAFLPLFATKIAVCGKYDEIWFKERGVPQNRILIIGHPRFDDIFIEDHMSKTDFQKKYKLNSQKKTILCATQPFNAHLWNKFIAKLAQKSQIEIIIKPHPYEMSRLDSKGKKLMDNYIELEKKFESIKLVLDRKANLYDILGNVDGVITINSTVGLEAILFNKPLFILDVGTSDYYKMLEGFIYSNPAELVKFVTEFYDNKLLQQEYEKKKRMLLTHYYPQELSGPLLVSEINKLIDNAYK